MDLCLNFVGAWGMLRNSYFGEGIGVSQGRMFFLYSECLIFIFCNAEIKQSLRVEYLFLTLRNYVRYCQYKIELLQSYSQIELILI